VKSINNYKNDKVFKILLGFASISEVTKDALAGILPSSSLLIHLSTWSHTINGHEKQLFGLYHTKQKL